MASWRRNLTAGSTGALVAGGLPWNYLDPRFRVESNAAPSVEVLD
jgi:hypothetical protein